MSKRLYYNNHIKQPNNAELINFNQYELINNDNSVSLLLSTNDIKTKSTNIIKSRILDKSEKIKHLKKIDQIEYKSLIHQLVNKQNLLVLELVLLLKDIGHLYIELGNLSGEVKYYTEATVYFQYITTLVNEKTNLEQSNNSNYRIIEEAHKQLNIIQTLIINSININKITTYKNLKQETEQNKNIIGELRNYTNSKVKEIESFGSKENNQLNYDRNQRDVNQKLFLNTDSVKQLFFYITEQIKSFIGKLYQESAKEIDISSPCEYTVIALGSLAMMQITPYSDLEFAIITKNNNYKTNNNIKIRNYFRNLTHLVNFKIINLGETIIPTDRYDLDMSHIVHKGISFDLGGKTPLGRPDKNYDLIGTIDWLLWYVKNEQNRATHIDKALPYILEKVSYICGNQKLIQTYQAKLKQFFSYSNLNGPSHCELRALKVLYEGSIEYNYSKLRKTFVFMKGNVEALAPNLINAQGKSFDIKQEIYRLPDRFLYSLGLHYGVMGDNTWDTINKLHQKNIISSGAAFNLNNAMTYASILRLKIYSYNKAQKEDMSVFSLFLLNKVEAAKDKEGELFKYFYTIIPFHKKIKEFCELYNVLSREEKNHFFRNENFYADDAIVKSLIYYRLLQYEKVQENLKIVLDDIDNYDCLQMWFSLGICLQKKYHKVNSNVSDNSSKINKEENIDINLIKESIEENNVHKEALTLNNLAIIDYKKGNYTQAIIKLEKTIELETTLCVGDKVNKKIIIIILNNLGTIFDVMKQFDQAIYHYRKSYELALDMYKGKPNADIAACLNNLAILHYNNDNKSQALKLLEKSLKINKLIYENFPHPFLANSYYNIGSIYVEEKNYQAAIPYLLQSLKVYKKINDFKNTAIVLHNLAFVHSFMKVYDEAINLQKQSIKTNKAIYYNQEHPDIAIGYHNLGSIYQNKGLYSSALYYLEKALVILIKFQQDYNYQLNVAATYNSIGFSYHHLEVYKKALTYYGKGLEILLKVYQDDPKHLDISSTYNNLGIVCRNLKDYEQALVCHKQSLKILKEIYQNSFDHPNISATYYCLSVTYLSMGNYLKAQNYVNQSLKIFPKNSDQKNFIKTKELSEKIILQLGNKALLRNQFDEAINYYKQIKHVSKKIDFYSKNFIEYQREESNIAYENKLLKCAINCQKVLLKLDPDLKYENYYHNLAKIYLCYGNKTKANYNFIKAFDYNKVSNILYIEYAQFLITNPDLIQEKLDTISDCLYHTIALYNNEYLNYGKLEQNSVCEILKNIIKQKNYITTTNNTIEIDTKVFAYYLLIKYPQYINNNTAIDDIFLSLLESFNKLKDEISFRLLTDAYKSLNIKEKTENTEEFSNDFYLKNNFEVPIYYDTSEQITLISQIQETTSEI